MRTWPALVPVLGAGLLLGAAAAGAAPQASATLEPSIVGVSQIAVLSVEVTETGLGHLGFSPRFTLDNFEQLGNPAKGESVSFVNGKVSRSLRLSFRLRPLHPGTAAVRNLQVTLSDGRVVALSDQPARVTEAPQPEAQAPGEDEDAMPDPDALIRRMFGQAPSLPRAFPSPVGGEGQAQGGTGRIFLKGEVDPPAPYVGQQVVYRLVLYSQISVDSVNLEHLPIFRGFWVRDFPQRPPTQEAVMVGGQRFVRVVLLKKALFPRRAGRYPLEPATLDLMALRTANSFFGSAIVQPQPLTLATDPVFVDVHPLPPAPPGWSGAVGRLALTASAEPREPRVGENVQIRLTLAGTGNLQGIPSPTLPAPAGLSIYPPEQTAEDRIEGEAVTGRRTWTFVAVPERAGRFALPLPAISYFDPARGSFQSAGAAAVTFDVRPKAAPAPGGDPRNLRSMVQGKPEPAPFPWLAVIAALATLPWGIALLIYVSRRRGRTAGRAGDPDLRELERALCAVREEPRPRSAALRLEEIVGTFLADRCGQPGPLPSSRWSAELAACGAGAESVAEAGHLAEEINYLRHAPQLSATDGLCREAVDRSLRLAAGLR